MATDQDDLEQYRAAMKRGDKGQAAEVLYTLRLKRRLRASGAERKRYFDWLGTPVSQDDPESSQTYLDRFPEAIQ